MEAREHLGPRGAGDIRLLNAARRLPLVTAPKAESTSRGGSNGQGLSQTTILLTLFLAEEDRFIHEGGTTSLTHELIAEDP